MLYQEDEALVLLRHRGAYIFIFKWGKKNNTQYIKERQHYISRHYYKFPINLNLKQSRYFGRLLKP